jgi:ketosteroid isomerase-like protein
MSQKNVEIVRLLFDVFNRQDAHGADDLWATDGEWWPAYIGGGLLEGAVFRGREGLAEFIELQSETWASVLAEPVEMRDLGDRVLVEVHLSAVGRASGIPVDRVTWNIFELRDGKAAIGRVYTTKDEALKALGLSE